jgi:ferredoxin
MKMVVDDSICHLHGVSVKAAPEVFKFGDDGRLQVLNQAPLEGLREKVFKAVQ